MKIKFFLVLFLFSIFLFLRTYKLNGSLEFFSDMGRDLYTLIVALQDKKPILLGPSISFLPLNQSPIYFYLLLPVFILTNYSLYTAVISINLIYLIIFASIFYFYKKNNLFFSITWLVFLLFTFHPEIITQIRYPWNPSFTPPFLVLALLALFKLRKKYTRLQAVIFSLSLAIATGITYSLVPTVLILLLYSLYLRRKNIKELVNFLAIWCLSFLLIFSPIFIFEIRHDFFFSKRLMMGEPWIDKPEILYLKKFLDLTSFILGSKKIYLIYVTASALIANLLLDKKNRYYRLFLALFLTSFILTWLMPFELYSHYIFGVLILWFFTLAFLKKYLFWPLLILLLFSWLANTQISKYLEPAKRTTTQLENCVAQVCQKINFTPTFASTQAWYDYHAAYDFLFLLNKYGCSARDITKTPGFAEQMVVFADQGVYTHNKTAFNELTLFGESREVAQVACPGNIRVHILQK